MLSLNELVLEHRQFKEAETLHLKHLVSYHSLCTHTYIYIYIYIHTHKEYIEFIILISVIEYSKSLVIGYDNVTLPCNYYSSGPPQLPSNLTYKLNPPELTLLWIAPSSPDGVQLNYTVTVTNTNTSVVTVFTTSYTNITLTRSTVEGDECDQHLFSVTTVNKAGISGPVYYTTALSFVPGIL